MDKTEQDELNEAAKSFNRWLMRATRPANECSRLACSVLTGLAFGGLLLLAIHILAALMR